MSETLSRTLTIGTTFVALVAFAANSVLCRMALLDANIDAVSFTVVRIVSGAITLAVLVVLRNPALLRVRPDWAAGSALFTYMVLFCFAYIALGAGIGALVLFGFVQLTMMSIALFQKEPFPPLAWFGVAVAVAGVVYLVSPGAEAPDAVASVQMAGAGIAWGAYSVIGRGSKNPLQDTASNFLLCVPFALILMVLFWQDQVLTAKGLALAVASGALASGCGYAIWFRALPLLTTARASILQLSVPIIASLGGVMFLSEAITGRLIIASVLVLGGIALVLRDQMQR
ncbi:MAG: DMT family transporter [Rhodobacteraceae bacterium]|nr:DMT family transporter [Paracoccaceae bacterium]